MGNERARLIREVRVCKQMIRTEASSNHPNPSLIAQCDRRIKEATGSLQDLQK